MGTAATRAKGKYNNANYDEVKIRVPKGFREELTEAIKSAGYDDRSEFIKQAIQEKLDRESIKLH